MAIVHYRDRVKDTTTSSGTDPIYLDNTPPTGYKSFYSGFYGTAGREPGTPPVLVGYCMVNDTNGEWEMGVGSYDGDRTITRAAVGYAIKANSTNSANATVNFAAGTKTVFCTPYSAGLPFLDDSQGFSSNLLALGSFANGIVLTSGTGGLYGSSVVSLDTNSTTLTIPGILKSSTNALTISPATMTQPYTLGVLTLTTSGASTGSAASSRAGGPLNITTGTGYLTGAGGKITIKPGSTGTAGASTLATGAAVTITGGDTTATTGSTGGTLSLNGGAAAGTTSSTGGPVKLTGGIGYNGGSITIAGGAGTNNSGGILLAGGDSSTGNAGGFTLYGGVCNNWGANPSSIIVDGNFATGSPSQIYFRAGDAGYGSGSSGGRLVFQLGAGDQSSATPVSGSTIFSLSNGGNAFQITDVNSIAQIGFFGATAVAQPNITGSRSSQTVAVLTDLLIALSNLGLITNSTT